MSQRFKDYENKDDEQSSFDFEIPDTKSVLGGLDEQLTRRDEIQKEHQDLMEKEEEDVKKGKKKKPRQKPKGGTICFCGNPHCNIGEFVELQE